MNMKEIEIKRMFFIDDGHLSLAPRFELEDGSIKKPYYLSDMRLIWLTDSEWITMKEMTDENQ